MIDGLAAEATADADVIGLVLMGSRSVGVITPESDYDVYFVVTDEAMARYDEQGRPARGRSVDPPIDTTDLFAVAISMLRREGVATWTLPTWADARILYDRDGATTRAIEALRRMPEDEASVQVADWYDTYLNAPYRSLKSWRRGNSLGGRLEAYRANMDAFLADAHARGLTAEHDDDPEVN